MAQKRVFISGMGIISPLGCGVRETRTAIETNRKALAPLSLFPIARNASSLVGEVSAPLRGDIPRTHQLARLAADEALADCDRPIDAIVIGTTTGGILTTERGLKERIQDPEYYRYHAVGAVADDIAMRYKCRGPVISVSTACSSGAVAISIAAQMIRQGAAGRVLAGGVDALCRLTYYGFSALQLIDPLGPRPFDKNRRGMALAEGAAMLLLTDRPLARTEAEISGEGLHCDAYHPSTPHPEGEGALAAMTAAILDAGLVPSEIDYINLHGTGTVANDLSEAKALQRLYGAVDLPLSSSVKGACGHSLGAAGAIEAVIAVLAVAHGLVPANAGFCDYDPELKLTPVRTPRRAPIRHVLSNSFGFGGNNAAVVISKTDTTGAVPGAENRQEGPDLKKLPALRILGRACITGAGQTEATWRHMLENKSCRGTLSQERICNHLAARKIRRLKRLSRMTLSLAVAAHADSGRQAMPAAVFVGTAWGSVSETHDFLAGLYETDEKFTSPTDFVGSVHNAPCGQVALHFQSHQANVTTSCGDYSFEQAVMLAGLLSGDLDESFLVVGADEFHPVLSRLFDSSVALDALPSDGGGAFCLIREKTDDPYFTLQTTFFEKVDHPSRGMDALLDCIAGEQDINRQFGALLVGIPANRRQEGERQLAHFLSLSGFSQPVIDYRKLIGEFGSASAVAAVMAVHCLEKGSIPGPLCAGREWALEITAGKGILLLGLGDYLTAMEVKSR